MPPALTSVPRPQRRSPLLALLLCLTLVIALIPGARAEAVPSGLGGFTPGRLMDDSVMFDGRTMSAAEIDRFLGERGSSCRTGGDGTRCLKDLRVNMPSRSATSYCSALTARSGVTVGRLLADVSRACSVNPRVLLALLQKEQGLVTTTQPSARRLEQALGFACPDFAGCDPRYAGLVNQVYSAASRLQEYGDPARGYTYRAGSTYRIAYSPYAFCGTGSVRIENRATAALYNYTPFTPTQATLDAGSAAVSGDVCATYGNRNMYRIYSQWFGAPAKVSTSRHPRAAAVATRPSSPFRDVTASSSIFVVEIAWMHHQGLSTGWPDGTYRPLQPITRDAMAAFLYRAAGSPSFTPPRRSPFRDVTASSSIFYKEITWAHSQGLTTGWPDGTYRPLEPIARDAMAAFLYRAAGSPSYTPPTRAPFRDVRASNSIFHREIAWVSSQGISTGWPDGTYRPLQPVARDAMAAFIYRQTVR